MSTLTGLILCTIAFASGYAIGHRNGVHSGTKDAIRRLGQVMNASRISGRL